ncbi:MAG TPA: septum site-determining protein Ssd [Nocardioidaceae bacterium]|nr:septum site-determining protein Ssd [Nocardioidaceae bacterium]
MTSPPALLITRDDELLEDLLRLSAAAGVSLDVAHDATGGLRGWSSASLVLLGSDLAARVAEQHPPRRDQVHVVGHGPLDDGLFRSAVGAGAVDVVELPAADAWLVELLSDAVDAADGGRGGRARTIGVVAGSGGAGATTLACAAAVVASASQTTLLLDLDPLGPGVDRVVGLDAGAGARWDALVSSRGRLGSRSLRAALPDRSGLAVLTWGAGQAVELDPASVREVLSAAQRGNDFVVVDLPRALDDVTAEVVTRCDVVLVVVEPTVPGVSAAGRVASALRPLNGDLRLAVRSGRGAIPSRRVAEALGLPMLLEVPHQRRLAEHVDLGLGPVPSRRSALAVAVRPALVGPTSGRTGR